MEQYLQVGTVISTHALKGEVKVYPTTEDVRRFDDLETVYAAAESDMTPCIGGGKDPSDDPKIRKLKVQRVRYFKNLVIVKFEGIDRIEDAEPCLKKNLYVSRDQAIPLEEGEHYVGDLFDLKVYEEETGRLLGTLTDVMETGANDVYIITREDDPKKELLIPATEECIRSVDPENGTMTVHLLGGMLD